MWFYTSDVTCRILGYQRGIPLCCSPYGFSFKNPIMSSFKCNGDERHLTDCQSTTAIGLNTCVSQDYASVACYNESATTNGISDFIIFSVVEVACTSKHCYSTFSTVCEYKKRKITKNIIVNSWDFITNLLEETEVNFGIHHLYLIKNQFGMSI